MTIDTPLGLGRRVAAVVATLLALGTAGIGAAGLPASAAAAPTPVWNVAHVGGPVSVSGVTIAVVDSGIQADHPAFGGRVLPQRDCTVGDGCPARNSGDGSGHGTHVAGTAAGGAVTCGGRSVTIGVDPTARILPIRVLGADGTGTFADVADGIDEAVRQGAAVVNLSLGDDSLLSLAGTPEEFTAAIERAWRAGTIPVLAAGNGGLFGGLFGSGYGNLNAVVVTSVTASGSRPGYATSIGSAKWGIAAPGGSGSTTNTSILSAWPGSQCALLNGTSMAAPHVSAALAILRGRGLSPQQAVDRILNTAAPAGSGTGSGQLDLVAAVGASPPTTRATTTTTTSPPRSTTTSTRPRATTSSGPTNSSSSTSSPSSTDGSTSTTSAAPGTVDDTGDDTTDDESASPSSTSPSRSAVPRPAPGPAPAEGSAVAVIDEDTQGREVTWPWTISGTGAVVGAWVFYRRRRAVL